MAHQKAGGAKPRVRQLNEIEHIAALKDKLQEEALEVANSTHEEIVHELADVQQVVDDLLDRLKISRDQLTKIQTEKLHAKGGFGEGLFIEAVEVAEHDPWTERFRNQPDRYPEITDEN